MPFRRQGRIARYHPVFGLAYGIDAVRPLYKKTYLTMVR